MGKFAVVFGLSRLRKGPVKGHYRKVHGKRTWIPAHTDKRTKKAEQPTLVDVPPQAQPTTSRGSAATEIRTTPKGNKQYLYPDEHYVEAARQKVARVKTLAAALPKIVNGYGTALAKADTPKDKVLAAIVALIDRCYFRIGSDRYAEAHAPTYGVSTLRPEHVDVHGNEIQFKFAGKKQVEWDKATTDPRLAAFVSDLKANAPGDKLFWYHDTDGTQKPVKADDVNAYLKPHGITAKDFRTYHATRLAHEALKRVSRKTSDEPLTKKEIKARIKEAVASVAEQLGHTVGVCKKSYILPQVLEHYTEHGGLIGAVPWGAS